jgi:hypothetical protein
MLLTKNLAAGFAVAALALAGTMGAARAGAPALSAGALIAPAAPVTQVQYCCGGETVGVASTVTWRPRTELREHTTWHPHTVLRPVTVWRPHRTVRPVTTWRPVVRDYYYYAAPVYYVPADPCCNSGLFGAF